MCVKFNNFKKCPVLHSNSMHLKLRLPNMFPAKTDPILGDAFDNSLAILQS